jgi:hypothetical protein
MDPGTSLAVASLVWDVGKDIYNYARGVKDCDEELTRARACLLQLCSTSLAVRDFLDRSTIPEFYQGHVVDALKRCLSAMKAVQAQLEKVWPSKTGKRQAIQRMVQRLGYPLLARDGIQDLLSEAESCQNYLDRALELLSLHVSADILQKVGIGSDDIERLDKALSGGMADVTEALRSLRLSTSADCSSISQQIEHIRNKLDIKLASSASPRRLEIVAGSLDFPERSHRDLAISEAHSSTLEWLFDL